MRILGIELWFGGFNWRSEIGNVVQALRLSKPLSSIGFHSRVGCVLCSRNVLWNCISSALHYYCSCLFLAAIQTANTFTFERNLRMNLSMKTEILKHQGFRVTQNNFENKMMISSTVMRKSWLWKWHKSTPTFCRGIKGISCVFVVVECATCDVGWNLIIDCSGRAWPIICLLCPSQTLL